MATMTEAAVLERLPQEIKVVNCAWCGRLACREQYRTLATDTLGVRPMGAFVRDKNGHPRPYCVSCFLDPSLPVHDTSTRSAIASPLWHRSTGGWRRGRFEPRN